MQADKQQKTSFLSIIYFEPFHVFFFQYSLKIVPCCAIPRIMNRSDDELKRLQSILEEKEKDLLLSASIGKELLEKNSKLEDKITVLQNEVQNATENLEQLNYQLAQKNDLISKLTSDDECGSQNGEQKLSVEF